MRLTTEQEKLLVNLVEAWRALPGERRTAFLCAPSFGHGRMARIALPNPSTWYTEAYPGDLTTLLELGYLRPGYAAKSGKLVAADLTNLAFETYEEIASRGDEPGERIEGAVRRLIADQGLRAKHAAAFAKLEAAESLLWHAETEESATTIGHLTREAMQLFATSLLVVHQPPTFDPDPARTKNRVRAVLDLYRDRIGEREDDLLGALLAYFAAANGMVQRQEHGSHTPGRQLTSEDSRRVVFYTYLAIVEVESVLRRVAPR
jgi:hypothetical protein